MDDDGAGGDGVRANRLGLHPSDEPENNGENTVHATSVDADFSGDQAAPTIN